MLPHPAPAHHRSHRRPRPQKSHLGPARPTCFLYRYSSAITRLIATLSYSIYLTHKQLIHLTHEFLRPRGIGDNSYLGFWICVAVSLLGRWLLHLVVEKPFLRLRDRWLARRKIRLTTPSQNPSSQTPAPAAKNYL